MKKILTNPEKTVNRRLRFLICTLLAGILISTLSYPVFAVNEGLLGERVQLLVDNATLKDALKEIERQSDYTFLYNDAFIDMNQKVSVSAEALSVKELLDAVLKNKGIKYTIIDNQIVLTRESISLQDKKSITGTITDSETGTPLPGVTIVELGTTNGTISDVDGKFSLAVAENARLSISFVGYVTEEIDVTGLTVLNINMVPDIISLEDVVVIGYGTVRKSDLTGAVSKVDEDLLAKTPAPDINQALQGKSAGVYITSNSGSPGAATTVRIRGVGTITNSDPLYVVDGVFLTPEEVNFINPEDIQSLQVLKDASATAIYGSRGANGVVMITTKNGEKGLSNVQVSYYQGIHTRMKILDMADADEFATINYRISHPESIDTFITAPDTVGNTNWFDEVFRTAKVRNVYFAATNGTEHSSYHFSAGYLDQEGVIVNSGFKRLNLKLNSKHEVKKFTFGQQVMFTNSNIQVVPEGEEYSSVMGNAISVDPFSKPYVTDSLGNKVWGPSLYTNNQNPVATTELGRIDVAGSAITGGKYDYIQNRLLGTFYAQVQPFKFLTFKSQVGGKLNFDKIETFRQKYYIETGDENPNSMIFNRSINTKYLIWENTLTFNHTIADNHNINVVLGATAEDMITKWIEVQNGFGPGLENEISELRYFNYYPDSGDRIGGSAYESALISYLGRVNYSFNNKYYLTASFRMDGSSKFGTGYEKNFFNKGRWASFPSFALMWKVSNEPFFPQTEILNSLKLRYGYGTTGNQNIGNYSYSTTVDPGYASYVFNQNTNTVSPGTFTYRGANPAIHWETTHQQNVGLDAGFFREKLTLSADFFIRKTLDMLSQPGISDAVGLPEAPYQNLGDVKNTGLEVTLGYRHAAGDFSFNVEGNISYIKNKVTNLTSVIEAGGFGDNDSPFIRIEEGYPIGYFYGYKTDGLFQTWQEVGASGQPGAGPGDVKFVDLDGDGFITTSDRTMIGNPHPDLTFGLNGQINYKWIDLSLFFQGTYGNDIYFPWIRWIYEGNASGRNYHVDVLDAWTPENTDTEVPRIGSASNNNFRWSNMMVYDGSYLRLKTLEIGFTIPASLTNLISVNNVRIYFNGTNLLTFTKYPWFDPEVGRSGREENEEGFHHYIYGVDYGLYPQTRAFIGGIQIGF